MDETTGQRSQRPSRFRSYFGRIVLALLVIATLQLYVVRSFRNAFQDERRIAQKIESLGGRVEYRFTAPAWVPQPIRHYGGVTSVSLSTSNRTLPEDLLSEIATLKHLKTLTLLGPQITDEAVAKLNGLRKLTGLYLGYSQLSDQGCEHLKGFASLEWIFLIHTQVGDKTCGLLQSLPSLKSIALNDTNVTDAGLEKLTSLSDLQYLGLAGTDVSDDGLKYLAGMRSLKRLDIGNTLISDEGMAEIRKGLTACTINSGPLKSRTRTSP